MEPAPTETTPPARRPRSALRRAYDVLVSPQLAIALLVAVLACCLVGVTVYRGQRAGEVIFATLWFNALLILLAVSAAAAFFTRIWRRRLTVVSAGMILFHLSFVAVLGGVVYNSLFRFEGVMRLTEGETLPNGEPESWDQAYMGRFFDPARLRGETTLVRMHANYTIGRENKRAAYEIEVRDGSRRERKIIYATEYFDFEGLRYFSSKEGYSVLVVLQDKAGKEIYGLHVPLQSYAQANGSHVYSTGSAAGPAGLVYPQPPEQARFELELTYLPGVEERTGQVIFQTRPLGAHGAAADASTVRKGLAPIGGTYDAGGVLLAPKEIRYWVGMNVRYDPGLIVILTSLCSGLAGMFLTLVGRLRQGARKRPPKAADGAGGDRREGSHP